jgi:hypothetical protein
MSSGASDWDLIIVGASIYDGLGGAPVEADVALSGDRIAAVGSFDGHAAAKLDARGLAIAPGFIDVHSHDDCAVLLTPEMDFKVMQGVTTDIVGNCGLGAAPYSVASRMFRTLHPKARCPSGRASGYMARLAKRRRVSMPCSSAITSCAGRRWPARRAPDEVRWA